MDTIKHKLKKKNHKQNNYDEKTKLLLSAQRLNIFHPFFLCLQLFYVKVLLAQTVCINELYSQAQVLKETLFFFKFTTAFARIVQIYIHRDSGNRRAIVIKLSSNILL